MNTLVLNRVAAWQATPIDKITVKKYPSGLKHEENGIMKLTDGLSYRYSKNYTVGKGKSAPRISLSVVTLTDDKPAVEKYLNSLAKKISPDQAKQFANDGSLFSVNYLDEYFEEIK